MSKGLVNGGTVVAKLQLFAKIAENSQVTYDFTENPQWLERTVEGELVILTPPLPMDQVYFLREQLLHSTFGKVIRGWFLCVSKETLLVWLLRKFKVSYPGFPLLIKHIPVSYSDRTSDSQTQLVAEIQALLSGRILLDSQLFEKLRERGFWPENARYGLEIGHQKGLVRWWPGIVHERWGVHRCVRCNAFVEETRPCWQCGRSDCPICVHCEGLGEVRGCSRLLTTIPLALQLPSPRQSALASNLVLKYELTTAQQNASNELMEFLDSDKPKMFVWAACGAGKTEVTFQAIDRVLESGGQVLFAIPRRDVVQELAVRLRESFPTTRVAQHFAGCHWYSEGALVVATTHQVLRFYQRFSLVILDEVDAFPYHGSEMLRYGLTRSLVPGGKLIEMTATPIKCPSAKGLVTIPARYHGHPLPVPRFWQVQLPHWDKVVQRSMPQEVVAVLAQSKQPYLVFVPTVAAAKQVGQYLQSVLSVPVCFCYGGDPEREMKRTGLVSGKFQIMVATSIMERGITIPKVQVMALYSDHPIFDVRTLVQIAGRVGRTAQSPRGSVWFVGNTITAGITQAIQQIEYLNTQAKQQGLLREE